MKQWIEVPSGVPTNTSTMSGTSDITRSSLLPAMWVGQRTNYSPDRFQKPRSSRPSRSVGETHSILLTNNKKECFIYGKRRKHTFFYHTAIMKHRGFMSRTLQLALPEWTESFPNIQSPTLGTRSRVPQSLLGATKARDTELWEMVAIRDFRLSTNQNIIIRSSHSQLIQINMKTTNVLIQTPNPLVRTWTRIWVDIATNNQQQTQSIVKI